MRRSWLSRALVAASMLGLLSLPARAADEKDKPDFPPDQIEQMVAPIALYPDPLLTNILMASTYPLEVVQADRWMKANAKLKGAELDKALASQTWEESVKSLCRVPDVLSRMSENLDWTSDLGDAFLGQQADVLAAVQRMRKKAENNGALKDTKEQKVVVEKVVVQEVEKEVIKIVPADPQVVYVPTYSAPVVYGSSWSYPSYYYPPMYTYPPGYTATASLVSFGVGMAVGAAVWGNCNWGGGWSGCCGGWGNNDIDIDRNVNVGGDVNIGRGSGSNRMGKWEHNPEHRRGVSYRNENTAQRFQGRESAQRREMSRQQARGYEQRGGVTRGEGGRGAQAGGRGAQAGTQQARGGGDRGGVRQPSAQSRGGERAGGRQTTAGSGARGASGRDAGAFSSSQRGSFDRQASQRGAASRGGYGGSGSYGGSRGSYGGGSYSGSRGGSGSRSYGGAGGGSRGSYGGGSRGGGGGRGGGGRGGGGGRRR